MTDLKDALPLLEQNVVLNSSCWSDLPNVHELTWGEEIDETWLSQLVLSKQGSRRRRVLITGADIVYRPSLFEPLLITLTDLYTVLHRMEDDVDFDIDIWFSCQSIRSHLNEFWEAAAERGFESQLLAVVELGTDKTILSAIQIHPAVDSAKLPSNDDDAVKKGHGIVWIVSLVRKEA